MVTTTYKVTGMTCEHCANAVTSEVSALGGVSDVKVDLVPSGVSLVTITSNEPLTDDVIGAALEEAGDYKGHGRLRVSVHESGLLGRWDAPPAAQQASLLCSVSTEPNENLV